MLTQLIVNHFAIVDHLIAEFNLGMSVITGETGAGKSISIDALNLCLGARADTSQIRAGADRIDISAHFLLDNAPSARNWLTQHQLDDENECIIRRVVTTDGRSKAYINNRAVPISQLKELAPMLIQIHGQHEHQQLTKNEYQQHLLDQYMDNPSLLAEMKATYKAYKSKLKDYQQFKKLCEEAASKVQLLQYQLEELDEFAPVMGEYELNDETYKKLSQSENLIKLSQQATAILESADEVNLLNQLVNIKRIVQDLVNIDNNLCNIMQMLDDITIQVQEISYELNYYNSKIETDPYQVETLEKRIAKQIALARKHQVKPESLPEFYLSLKEELSQFENQDQKLADYKESANKHYLKVVEIARKLHQNRLQAAQILSEKITASIQELSMPHGQFKIEVNFDENKMNELGMDVVTFLVTTNPGQPLQSMQKVASGGELSRIALAVQVLTAQKIEMPALIFDEIDVGISGQAAVKVGHLLRELGQSTQVITVTHLPQVAGNGHHHFYVKKETDGTKTNTSMQLLTKSERLNELARLIGGEKITKNTLANAKELLITS